LLEPTTTNGQQNNTFLDSSTNNFTITRNGTTTQGSVTPYWPNGYWSNYFDGSSYLTTSYVSNFDVGTGDLTLECWVYLTSVSGVLGILSNHPSPAGGGFGMYTNNGALNSQIFTTGAVAADSITGTTLSLNTWYHVAITRSSGTMYLWLNGVSQGSTASSRNPNNSSGFYIGSYEAALYKNFGYISNIRFVKGQALATGNFTPPTSPVTTTTVGWTGANAAPSLTGTVQLLTCQSNRFIDNSNNNLSMTVSGGTPKVQAFQPFSPTASYTTAAYGGSGYFGSGTDNVTTPANTAFAFGTSDFTIEAWVYTTASGAIRQVFYSAGTSIAANGVQFFINSSNQLSFTISFVAVIATSSGTISPNTWTHIAVTRSGTSLRLFINGNIDGTATNSTNIASTTTNYVGSSSSSTESITGYISNLRVVKGTAVYTGAFTPPTLAPLTTAGSTSAASYSSTTNVNTSFAAANTSLLTNFTNAGIYDAAVQNNVITVGDAQASTTQSKWSPTSIKFDGTGDWLTAIDSPQLQIGTGDFTIDGWVYLSAIGVAYGIISKGTATTGWSVNVTTLNKLQFSYTASVLTGATSLATGTWYYFAVVRSGSATGNLKVYLNGTVDATSGGAVTDNFNQTSILYVGADRIGTSALNGYLQDIRITKYARTITTPTAAFPTR
jgi:hypothetical protein